MTFVVKKGKKCFISETMQFKRQQFNDLMMHNDSDNQ